MGKLIVFEGLDGSGKSTQLNAFTDRLKKLGKEYRQIKLPDYEDDSSALVRMYLNGRFGSRPSDVNAFAASAFYAVDRYAGFKAKWGEEYNSGKLIVADRYTTSNAVHQCSKLSNEERDSYLEWLYDFEFGKLELPKPDMVIFFDMPPEVSQKLMTHRYDEDESKKDIHERDVEYLEHCRQAALYAADKLGWQVIKCSADGEPLSIEQIADKVWELLSSLL